MTKQPDKITALYCRLSRDDEQDGQNQMLKDGVLSETARKAIAGMMELAPSITS